MRKIIIASAVLAALSSSALADPEIKVTGKFDFTSGYLNQKSTSDVEETDTAKIKSYNENKNFTRNNKNFGFNSRSLLTVDVSNTTETGAKYGAKLGIAPLHKNPKSNPSFLYIESDAGKIEVGAGRTAMSQMKIEGDSVTVGGVWDVYYKDDPWGRGIEYLSSQESYLDQKTRDKVVEFNR